MATIYQFSPNGSCLDKKEAFQACGYHRDKWNPEEGTLNHRSEDSITGDFNDTDIVSYPNKDGIEINLSPGNCDRKNSITDKISKPIKFPIKNADITQSNICPNATSLFHTEDLSSDDDEIENLTGSIPLHWYDDYDHVGYDINGTKVMKPLKKNGIIDNTLRKYDVCDSARYESHDPLHSNNIVINHRQIEIASRIQNGSFAHPEFDAYPDFIDYFTCIKEISGLDSNRYERKSSFCHSIFEKSHIQRLLEKIKNNDTKLKDHAVTKKFVHSKSSFSYKLLREKSKELFLLWKGNEEDELNVNKVSPIHLGAPKTLPPGNVDSYNPPEEYLPSSGELAKWKELPIRDRPHGLMLPKKHDNLRSVGSYEHSVRELFERCLDLYLCPRVMKRRLNIDPESLVPSLPNTRDLRPFPTVKCLEYVTHNNDFDKITMVRCLSISPDGQFLVSGATDSCIRLWEVQTGRLLRTWNVSTLVDNDLYRKPLIKNNLNKLSNSKDADATVIRPVVSVEWNPLKLYHCLLVAIDKYAIIIATGTGDIHASNLTEKLFDASRHPSDLNNAKGSKHTRWESIIYSKNDLDSKESDTKNTNQFLPISSFGGMTGPIVSIKLDTEVNDICWHKNGDYFVTVSSNANLSGVFVHQLSLANSQHPFNSSKSGKVQCACFHPNKPFLFVASQQHVRVYNLVTKVMVKSLLPSCRYVSSMDIHPSGDHIAIGSFDRRLLWFDLDLGRTPYKTLKYHERAIRSVRFHKRYPLVASASDDGSVHVFHCMVYTDLMKNPLIVPVKILREYDNIQNENNLTKSGILDIVFHPTQPWLFTAQANGKILLYQDI